MNLGEIPVVENTFSLPQNVFEQVWSSQQRVSNASTSAVSTRTEHSSNTAGQYRRPSGDYVTELTGSEAKRPRLSPSVQAFAQKMHHIKQQQKQLKLQLIMQRLNNTREKVCRLLQLQKSRESLRQHKNPSDNSTNYETVQRRYVLLQRRAEALNSIHGSAQDKNNVKHSQFQGPRRVRGINIPAISVPGINVPGINVSGTNVPGVDIVLNGVGSTEQRSDHSCNSLDSAGLALDHQKYPKIVAVHSVIENSTLNTESCGTTESRPYHGAGKIHERNNIIIGRISEFVGRSRSDYLYEKSKVRQKVACSPLTNNTTSVMSNSNNYEDDEVVLTKVIPGKVRRSTSTQSSGDRKHDEADLANCNQHSRNNSEQSMGHVKHLGHADGQRYMNNQKHAEHPGYVSHPGIVNHPEHKDHPGTVNYTGHTDQQENAHHCPESEEHFNRPENVYHSRLLNSSTTKQFESEKEKQKGSFEHSNCAGSELELGGPPPYLPVLNSLEMIEQEKEMSHQRPVSNPTSPRLTKTLPEISEKIMETRERIKNETIDWKKCVLYRLEKRLIQKLRRVERLTGQKTEVEDLRQEVPETVTKGKKGKGKGKQRRTSREDSVTESVMDDNGTERQGQERRSRQDSVTDSVTDDNAVERHGQEKISSLQSTVTDDDAGELQGEEKRSSRRDSVTDSVTADDDQCPGRLQQDEKVERSDNKQIDSSNVEEGDNHLSFNKKMDICEDLSKKCEESKNAEISCAEKGNMERLKNFISDNKEDKFTNMFKRSEHMWNNINRQFNTDEKQGEVELEVTNTNNSCVTIEHSQDATALQTKRKSDTIVTESAQKQKTELSKVSQENPRQQLQCDNDKSECVALRSNTSGKHRAVERENLFETFKTRSQASHSPKKDTLRLPVTNKEASINTTQDTSAVIPAEKEKPIDYGAELFMNKTFIKTLESCCKETRGSKLKTDDCERNIWSTLKKSGVF